MSASPKRRMSVAEYLVFERGQTDKHEYFEGEIFLQAGASVAHNLITANLIAALRPQLRGGPCRVYPSDIRLKIPNRRHYVYADVTIICGPPVFDDAEQDTVRNPILIIEVLSPSTEQYDRGRKFQSYRTIAGFQEYLLVAQDTVRVEHFVRQSDLIWTMAEHSRPDAVVDLAAVGARLALEAIYEDVAFPDAPADGFFD
ncbi:MAG TPA: Uma2 family endonuclease [Roseiflexaceae bacterium]|nr:Uma2 family endonuclease [Roseiflexaceae bacterium]